MCSLVAAYNSVYWEGLNKRLWCRLLVHFPSFRGFVQSIYPLKKGSTRYQGGVSVSCLDRWSTKIDLYSLGRHFKNENKTYTIVQSYYWDNEHYKMYYTGIKIISKLLVQKYIPIRLQLMKVCALCTPVVVDNIWMQVLWLTAMRYINDQPTDCGWDKINTWVLAIGVNYWQTIHV